MAETVLFLHIPKTAGTTIHYISSRQYSADEFCHLDHQPDFFELSAERRQQIRFLKGSYWFGLHEHLPHPFTYVTLLRDPLKRVVSLYDYTRKQKGHGMHKVSNRYSLAELYTNKLHKEALDNGQTRRISGVWDQVPYGGVTADIFEQAKQNLIDYFSVVGTTERFDETLVLLKQRLNWRYIYYTQRNTAQYNKAKKSALSEEDQEIVMNHNQWDQKLYQFASQLLDESITAGGDTYQRKLATFQRMNTRIQPWHRFYWGFIRKVSVRTMLKQMSGRYR